MLLQLSGIKKSWPDKEVLNNTHLQVDEGDRLFLLGRNGAGKSTLLKIIEGSMEPDDGVRALSAGAKVAYLRQNVKADDTRTVWEYLLEAGKDVWKKQERLEELAEDLSTSQAVEEYEKLLKETGKAKTRFARASALDVMSDLGLEAECIDRPMKDLSGGQRQKTFLARLAFTEADLLLLDEPTNHLDLLSIRWLEDFMKKWRGAALIVSHDERFISGMARRILYLTSGKLEIFDGGWSGFLAESVRRREAVEKKIKEQEEFIEKAETVIAKFGAGTRAGQARAKEKQLERLELVDAPIFEKEMRKIHLPEPENIPNDVLTVKDLSFSWPDTKELVLDKVNLHLRKGEKAALLGVNGAGKTTLMRLISSELEVQSGNIRTGSGMVPAQFSQDYRHLGGCTPFDLVRDKYRELKDTEIRNMLGAFLFGGDSAFLPMNSLSGGECARLELMLLLMEKPTFILLDEPTNNLDLTSIGVLRSSLSQVKAPLLMTSHDRGLLREVCNTFWVLAKGKVTVLKGAYDDLEERILDILRGERRAAELTHAVDEPKAKPADDVKKPRKPNSFKVAEVEKKISELEDAKKACEVLFEDPAVYSDHIKLAEAHARHEEIKKELDVLYLKWEELNTV